MPQLGRTAADFTLRALTGARVTFVHSLRKWWSTSCMCALDTSANVGVGARIPLPTIAIS
jgi:hypothetical protein